MFFFLEKLKSLSFYNLVKLFKVLANGSIEISILLDCSFWWYFFVWFLNDLRKEVNDFYPRISVLSRQFSQSSSAPRKACIDIVEFPWQLIQPLQVGKHSYQDKPKFVNSLYFNNTTKWFSSANGGLSIFTNTLDTTYSFIVHAKKMQFFALLLFAFQCWKNTYWTKSHLTKVTNKTMNCFVPYWNKEE